MVPKLGILLFLLLAVGIFLIGRIGKGDEPHTYSEKYVGITEVKQELSFGIYGEEDWDSFFAVFHREYLTSDMLEQLLDRLDMTDYIELPGMTGRHTLTREEWNLAYGQILDLLDMERSVKKETLLILDTMEAEKENVLITNQGDYYTMLPVSYFETWNGYEIYSLEGECLGIVGISQEELYVQNAYLEQFSGGTVDFLFGGAAYQKEIGALGKEVSAGVCDLVFSGGNILSLRMKQDSIKGGLLSYDDATIEIEGYGKISHSGKVPVYQTYGEVAEKSLSDVILGNMEVEYVTGEDQVCAILIRQPADIRNIRVLLLAEEGTNFRKEVYLTCDTGAVLTCGEQEETVTSGTVVSAAEVLAENPGSTLVLSPENEEGQITVCDGQGSPLSNGYHGTMEVRSYEEGYTLVNQLPFETYLTAVVPSEMPSSYAPEALKAQAVCARSYAYIQLLRADLAQYGAHINDSTSYQVYNKVPATEESVKAVQETAGQMLTYQGNTVEAYYFSTSMGYTDTAAVWNVEDEAAYGYLKSACLNTAPYEGDLSKEDEFLDYIQNKAEGYDSEMKYYRWFASADYREKTEEIGQILLDRRAVSERNIVFYEPDGETECSSVDSSLLQGMGKITGISVLERSRAGSILTLEITYEKGSVHVKTEYNIRKVLGICVENMVYADSSESRSVTMLPSAFCAVIPNEDGTVTLQGGGYGHGLGMSQNGANGMAKAGMNYEDILHYFYNDIMIGGIQ